MVSKSVNEVINGVIKRPFCCSVLCFEETRPPDLKFRRSHLCGL